MKPSCAIGRVSDTQTANLLSSEKSIKKKIYEICYTLKLSLSMRGTTPGETLRAESEVLKAKATGAEVMVVRELIND